MTPQQFIATIAPSAVAFMRARKISAALIIAQGALESGWGRTASAMGNNIFGIKADSSWNGPTTTQQTKEYVNGEWVMVTAKFRAYPSIQACLEDHDEFLLQSRYANLVGVDYKTACHLIATVDHYATDPTYEQQLLEIINEYVLAQYDQQVEEEQSVQHTNVVVNGHEFDAVVVGGNTYVLWTDLETLPGFSKENVNGEWHFTVTTTGVDPAKVQNAESQIQEGLNLLK